MKANSGLASTGNFLLISLFVHTRKYAKHTNAPTFKFSASSLFYTWSASLYSV